MMTMFLITLALFLIVFIAMAIGYIVQQKSLAGSCGGLGTLGIDKACNCDNPCEKRQERDRKAAMAKGDIEIKNI
ncbi:(Na+)-NQR maturation NqrM [Endozoicomonas sp. G2_1]|uniref:(Na+)-NQR maturation NqrM n=1 Tax=Endozoicomonas sp. G2_1 TaxID=2821091 RepID=UPI001AD9CEBB|nr:(Na+)-NQR maturation NqrM [Endozoicomonas sp. G2_1]MBO9489401.1 (Na+)-NQR maturation NqrM [Endozoicomonas sp. G2_1]